MGPDSYIHGYATPEQERLIAQALHWRDDLILDGTNLAPGTRLLEVGVGVGAVLGVLGQAFPGTTLAGVDIEPRQIDFARRYLADLGLDAELQPADARALPFADASFDHVWMMWFLEHLDDPVSVLREARRVLVPGGGITAIEVDYSTAWVRPPSAAIEALYATGVRGMDASGRSDAGTQVSRWLAEAGFRAIDPGERVLTFTGDAIARQANYVADVWDSAIPSLAQLRGAPAETTLRGAVAELRELDARPDAALGWIVHKAQAVA
ncbi:MAG: class I SAM-dependent methyltransferase [Thermoleophilaceae bacterium]